MKTKEIILTLFFVADVDVVQCKIPNAKKKVCFHFWVGGVEEEYDIFCMQIFSGVHFASFSSIPRRSWLCQFVKKCFKEHFLYRGAVKFQDYWETKKKWTWPRALKSLRRKSLYDPLYSRLIYRLSELRKVWSRNFWRVMKIMTIMITAKLTTWGKSSTTIFNFSLSRSRSWWINEACNHEAAVEKYCL